MRRLFRFASGVLPTNLLVKGVKASIIAPFYHLVSDNPPPHVKHLYRVLSVTEFENDLEFLLKYFQPVDANALIDHLDNKIEIRKPALFLSFDDGFREAKEVIAPILQRKGVPATFFVNPAFVNNANLMYRCKISLIVDRLEITHFSNSIYADVADLLNVPNDLHAIKKKLFQLKHTQSDIVASVAGKVNLDFDHYLQRVKPYLAVGELQELNRLGFTIGGHGYNHVYFNQITLNEQLVEVESCMEWIHSYFPNQLRLFAFPFTDFGVSNDLIEQMVFRQDKLCDITLGTSGIQPIRFNRHLQRIPMEDRSALGRKIVRGEILYYLAKVRMGHYRRNHD